MADVDQILKTAVDALQGIIDDVDKEVQTLRDERETLIPQLEALRTRVSELNKMIADGETSEVRKARAQLAVFQKEPSMRRLAQRESAPAPLEPIPAPARTR